MFDFTQNPKQGHFFHEVLSAVAGNSPNRNFGIFGGIRSGKTSCVLTTLFFLAKKFENSRWHVIRKSYPEVLDTVQSFEKIFPQYTKVIKRWIRSPSNYHVEFTNGSRIIFDSAKEKSDPEMNWMLGLESNGIFLEQIEGLTRKAWERAAERTGSWYIDPMPPAVVFWTCNPTQNWIKEEIFTPWSTGELPKGFYAIQINPVDSPFITDDQWNNWSRTMHPVSYAAFINGDWDSIPKENTWIYDFNEKRFLTTGLRIETRSPIYLNFDFNVDPMTCIIEQHGDDWSHWIKEIRQKHSDIYQLCDQLIALFGKGNPNLIITGDATGHNRNSIAKTDMNTHYKVIKKLLGLHSNQIKVFKRNPYHNQSRIEINGFLYNFPEILIDREGCPQLIKDMKLTEALADGHINKQKYDPHSLDAFRYGVHMWHRDWIKRFN